MAGRHWSDRVGTKAGRKPLAYSGNKAYLEEFDRLDKTPIVSSNVAAAAYHDDFARLYVEFKGTGSRPPALYVYHSVPRPVYEGLLSAASAGNYVWDAIRGKGTDSIYGYEQLY